MEEKRSYNFKVTFLGWDSWKYKDVSDTTQWILCLTFVTLKHFILHLKSKPYFYLTEWNVFR